MFSALIAFSIGSIEVSDSVIYRRTPAVGLQFTIACFSHFFVILFSWLKASSFLVDDGSEVQILEF